MILSGICDCRHRADFRGRFWSFASKPDRASSGRGRERSCFGQRHPSVVRLALPSLVWRALLAPGALLARRAVLASLLLALRLPTLLVIDLARVEAIGARMRSGPHCLARARVGFVFSAE